MFDGTDVQRLGLPRPFRMLGVATAAPASYAELIRSHGPVGYWRLGETSGTQAADSSGNARHGTYNNAPTLGVAGALGSDTDKAATFNGTDEDITVAAGITLADNFTFECWFKIASGGGYVLITQPDQYPGLSINSSSKLQLVHHGVAFLAESSITVPVNRWVHAVGTKNGSDRHIYLDGVDVTVLQTSSTIASASVTTSFASFFGSSFLNGSLDEVAVYSRALSAAEVRQHFVAAQSPYAQLILQGNPVGYWRLGEASGTVAQDLAAGRNGTYRNTPTLGVTGALASDTDKAVTFDGVNEDVEVLAASMPSIGDIFSLECWVKAASVPAGAVPLMTSIAQTRALNFNSNGLIAFHVPSGSSLAVSSIVLPLNRWVHVVGTKNGAERHLYFDGVDVTSLVTNTTIASSATALYIASYQGTACFAGSLDEVAIYPRALSAAEVRSHYLAAQSPYAKMILDANPVGYWRLGETSGTVAQDSAAGRNGTYINTPTLGVAGAISGDSDKAVTFDGATELVDIPSNAAFTLTDNFTLECWVKIPALPTGTADLIHREAGAGYEFYLNTAAQLALGHYGSTYIAATNAIPLNVWVHCVATLAAGTPRVYVNGVENTAFIGSPPMLSSTPAAVKLGASFAGSLDEATIYPRALSSGEVKQHYLRGVNYFHGAVLASTPKLYWRFNETSGTTTPDLASGGLYPGTYVGSPQLNQSGGRVAESENRAVKLSALGHAIQRVAGPTPATGISAELLVRIDALPTGGNYGLFLSVASGILTFYVQATGTLGIGGSSGGSASASWPGWPDAALGRWVHLVWTVPSGGAGTAAKCYFNGAALTLSGSGTWTLPSGDILVGRLSPTGNDWAQLFGTIDEFVYYDKVLTPAEVQAHFAASGL